MLVLLLTTMLADTGAGEAARVVERFHAALAAGDRAQALELLDPAVVIYEQGGAELSRDEYASHHLGDDLAFAGAVARTVVDRRQDVAGDLAWVITRSEAKGRFRERDVATRNTETMVLRRTAGAWRIVHVHWSGRAQKKSP